MHTKTRGATVFFSILVSWNSFTVGHLDSWMNPPQVETARQRNPYLTIYLHCYFLKLHKDYTFVLPEVIRNSWKEYFGKTDQFVQRGTIFSLRFRLTLVSVFYRQVPNNDSKLAASAGRSTKLLDDPGENRLLLTGHSTKLHREIPAAMLAGIRTKPSKRQCIYFLKLHLCTW